MQNAARVQQMDDLKRQMVADAELLQQVLQMVSRGAEQPSPTVRLDDLDGRVLLWPPSKGGHHGRLAWGVQTQRAQGRELNRERTQ